MNPINESIIRTDRRGRLRYTAEQKQTLIEAYESSGLRLPLKVSIAVGSGKLTN